MLALLCLRYSQRARDGFRSEFEMTVRTKSPKGIIAVGIFLFFGAMMASLAGTTLSGGTPFLTACGLSMRRRMGGLHPLGKRSGFPFSCSAQL